LAAATLLKKQIMNLTDYRTLGKSGLRISPLTLGTMTFGTEWNYGTSAEEATKIMDAYVEWGGNSIDTANIYTKGHSEKIVGDYLKNASRRRDHWVIGTKFFANLYPGDPNAGGNSRKSIIQALENSLRRLQTDYIDIYWMHAYDEHTPIEETLSALNELIRSGKVRYIGVSNTPAWKITQAQLIAQFNSWSSFIGLQAEYSLLERTIEGEIIPMAQELGMGIMPWSPLKQGVLSGKYTRENKGQKQSNRAIVKPERSETEYVIIDQLLQLADGKNVAVSGVALAWVISRAGVTSTIIGARTVDQLKQNLSALNVTLTGEEIKSLDEISQPVFTFPLSMLKGGAWNMSQAGTTVNGITSVVPPLLPQTNEERF
jgi:aryl-alcohol dehydrogenase-like predicted oxidoreductase